MKLFNRILIASGILAIVSSALTAIHVAETVFHYGICAFVFIYGIGMFMISSALKRDSWSD